MSFINKYTPHLLLTLYSIKGNNNTIFHSEYAERCLCIEAPPKHTHIYNFIPSSGGKGMNEKMC